MAFSSKLRNRVVGALVIVSIILILLPVMMQDRPVPVEPIKEKPIAVDENGAVTDANGLLASQQPDYAELLEPYDDLGGNEEQLSVTPAPVPSVPAGKVEVLDLPDDSPFAAVDNKGVPVPNTSSHEEILVAKKPSSESKTAVAKSSPPAAVPTARHAEKGAFTIQVGVFSQDSNAQNVVKKLSGAGIAARSEKVKVNGRSLNRVYAGSSNSREALQKLLPQIEKLTGAKGKIVSAK